MPPLQGGNLLGSHTTGCLVISWAMAAFLLSAALWRSMKAMGTEMPSAKSRRLCIFSWCKPASSICATSQVILTQLSGDGLGVVGTARSAVTQVARLRSCGREPSMQPSHAWQQNRLQQGHACSGRCAPARGWWLAGWAG